MRSGLLDKRISIQKMVKSQNETREVIERFVEVISVWASIEPLSGREFFTAQQIQGDVSTRIRIRHHEGLNRTMRVVYRRVAGPPEVFDVFEVDTVLPNMEDRREMFLMCRKIDSEGFRVDGNG